MSEPEFKVVVGAGDWGSPLSYQPSFKTLEEAQAAAREYSREQQENASSGLRVRPQIEEKRADGTIAHHAVD